MSMTYRYALRRDNGTREFIADVSVTDPSPELVLHNALGMSSVIAVAMAQALKGGPWKVIVFESIIDSAPPPPGGFQNVQMPYNVAATWVTDAGVAAILKEFQGEIATSLPPPAPPSHGHGHKK